MLSRLFFFKDLDDHYVILLFGIRLVIKHKSGFKYKQATNFGLNKPERNPKLIVSLTTYPARINTVHKTINTLLQQTVKPDKIILWLAESQFPGKEKDLPSELLRLKDLGLSIEWCEDLKSYKKLIPAIQKYPQDIIVTADDDVYYEKDMLESLYNAYLKDSSNIYVRRAVKLELEDNEIKSISSRKYLYQSNLKPTYLNQIMGGSGCLYPQNSLHSDITNLSQIKSLIPTHDDAYFWGMAVLNKTKIQVIKGFDANLYYVEDTQDVGLIHTNKEGSSGVSLSDAHKRLVATYPEIIDIIKTEKI